MLSVSRRIGKLERAAGLIHRGEPVEHRIVFINGEGQVTGTLMLSLAERAHTVPRCTPLRCSIKHNAVEMFDGTSLLAV